jgi:hypothetical protein
MQVRFQVLILTSMKMTVFWDVAQCSLVKVNRRFRGTRCLHHQDDEQVASISETSVNYQTARRNVSENSHLFNSFVYTMPVRFSDFYRCLLETRRVERYKFFKGVLCYFCICNSASYSRIADVKDHCCIAIHIFNIKYLSQKMLNTKRIDLSNQFFSLCLCESVLYNEEFTKSIVLFQLHVQ